MCARSNPDASLGRKNLKSICVVVITVNGRGDGQGENLDGRVIGEEAVIANRITSPHDSQCKQIVASRLFYAFFLW
jgi:hypothetical protein